MAIQANIDFKGLAIIDAYLMITRVTGGKPDGFWHGHVGVFANKDLSKPTEKLIRAAVPSVPEIPATSENMMVPGIEGTEAEYETIPADPIAVMQVRAKYVPENMNAYELIYAELKKAVGGIDV